MTISDLKTIDKDIFEALKGVSDPEIPVLTIIDLGIIRAVSKEGNQVFIKITPTYSGCPAMDTIGVDIHQAILDIGYEPHVELVLSPAWTTDWITAEGRENLRKYGISPPLSEEMDKNALLHGERVVPCPQCKSTSSRMISQFGSTACKSLFKCEDCLEVFDYFKCLK